ncbi:oligo-1,6-glucosidase [Microdochium nivale]|nr:oligo-1,6-glucosidase [Microdochium nivale]
MSTAAVKRACDACHRRKVKCDGINPCRNCDSAQLTCTYNAIPQKKGPKGSRAKVISELRETQRQTSLSAKIHNRLNGIDNTAAPNPSLAPTPGMLTSELVKESIEFYFANMYSIMPILDRPSMEPLAIFPEQNTDTYCLFTSMSAFMLLQPGMSMPGLDPMLDHVPGSSIIASTLLIEETLRVRKSQDFAGTPGFESLCTSFFLYCANYALELHDKAWFYLREAATMAHIAGMAKEESYASLSSVESSRRRRLYWLLFVAERAYALKYDRPVSLPASIHLPTMTDDPTDPLAHQLNPFVLLASLFRPFDEALISSWNKTRGDCTPSYLGALQKQFASMMPPYMNGQDAQLSELRANQQWLKTVAWRLSMPNGCVPQSEDGSGYHHTIDMSRDLISLTSQLSTQNTESPGVPFVSKMFNISCDLTDVLSMQPSSGSMFGNGPREQLNPLLQLVSTLRSGEHHFLPLLLHKTHELLPRLVDPSLQRAPENSCGLNMNIDIFDGFGNAGMAQAPMMTDFKSEPFTPAQAPRMDDMIPDSSSSNGTGDMKSPFPMVSSPAILSPSGMEYPHIGDYSTINDMMSPMGQNPTSSLRQHNGISSQHGHQQQHMPQHQQQHTHQHHSLTPQTAPQTNISSHMQANQQSQPSNLNQQQNVSPGQAYGHLNQGMLNQGFNRQPAQRTNSYMMQQAPHISRTMGDYHHLQSSSADSVPMNTMVLNPISSAEMDFSNLR